MSKIPTQAARRRIQTRRSGVHGKGVFAVQDIAEGETIIEYVGEIISWPEAQARHPHNPDDPNHTFYFHIDFDNLTTTELGLLCYALRPTAAFRHKLGMGKSIGLGRVRIEPLGIFYIDRAQRYQETDLDSAPRYHSRWLATGARLSQRYEVEQGTSQEAPRERAFEALCEGFRDGMNLDVRRALELLGDPAQVRARVTTPVLPQQQGAMAESETYRWFVENDAQGHQHLKPLGRDSDGLPTLRERGDGT